MAGAGSEVLNGVGAEQVRRGRIWRAGAIFCSRGGLHRRIGRLQDILETARPSSGVFWPLEVGVSRLSFFAIIAFGCRFDLDFGLIWLLLLLPCQLCLCSERWQGCAGGCEGARHHHHHPSGSTDEAGLDASRLLGRVISRRR